MARRREKFFNLPSLLVIGALVSLALFILFPRQAAFEDINYLENPDALSIAYLRVLVRADPDNAALRINLGRMLRRTGQSEAARRALEPLLGQENIPSLAMEEYLKLLEQRVYAATSEEIRDEARRRLFTQAFKVPDQQYSFDRQLSLLSPLLNALRPAESDQILQLLQREAERPSQKLALARRLATLREAQGAPDKAADALTAQFSLVSDNDLRNLVQEVLRLKLASANPAEALEIFLDYIANQEMSDRELEQGIRISHLAGAPEYTRLWLSQLAIERPDDIELQRELLASQLADNKVHSALDTIRRLQRHPQQLTNEDTLRIAQVFEWNNRPEEALPVWLGLYRETNRSIAYERALALAQGLFDTQATETLLRLSEQRGELSPNGYQALADISIQDGRIDQALAVLDRGLQQHPQSDFLQERKLSLLINTRDFQSAIDILESRQSLSEAQRLELANLYWRLREPEKAFKQLEFQSEDPTIDSERLALRLRLGAYLGRLDAIQDDYLALLTGAESAPPILQEQLLGVSVLLGDLETAIRFSNLRYEATGAPRYLAYKAEYQAALQKWTALPETLDAWLAASQAAEESSRYWILRALVHQQQEQIAAADQAYRRAYRLQPEDRDVLTGWAWLQMSDIDQFRHTLPHLLARLSREPDPETYPVLAYGYSALGETWQARQWFLRGLPRHRNEPEWVWSTANILDQTGNPRAAHALLAGLDPRDFSSPETRAAVYRSRGLDRHARGLLRRPLAASAENPSQLSRALGNQAQTDDNALLAETWYAKTDSMDTSPLYAMPESREEQAGRLNRQLDTLESPQTGDAARQRLRDTISLHQQFPRSLQLGSEWQDLGNFSVHRARVTGHYATEDFTLEGDLRSLNASGSGRLLEKPGRATEGGVALTIPGNRFDATLGAEQLARPDGYDTAWQLETRWQPADRWSVSLGLGRNERAPDSAESWWLVGRDREYLGASYSPWSRLSLYGEVAALHHHSEDGDNLGDGHSASLTGSYTLWREDPAFTLSAGYQRQSLDLTTQLPASVQADLDTPLEPASLLTEDYERLGIAARWNHGEPHARYRTAPSPRAFLEIGGGYVLSTETPEIGIGVGVGWTVLGDDELALSGRWTSEGLDGSGRADLNLTYTIFPGR